MSQKRLFIDVGHSQYPVYIKSGLLKQIDRELLSLGILPSQKLFILTDEHVAPLYLDSLVQVLEQAGYSIATYIAPAGETAKSLSSYEQVVTHALQSGLDRRSVILALGGGVVGDLAGFVASTYMRGIPFVQLPTTILAHDSSIGGKVAINHPLGKNLIGSFYQPLAVLYDTSLLKSLPQREISSGFAEVLKLGAIWDSSFYRWLIEHAQQLLALEEPYITESLFKACSIKAEIVSQDEREHGIRALLNFGHTFGHALETYFHYELPHGECVAFGMLLAARLSEEWYQKEQLYTRLLEGLEALQLPTSFRALTGKQEDINYKQIIKLMARDKKAQSGQHHLILIPNIGQAELVKAVPEALIMRVLHEF